MPLTTVTAHTTEGRAPRRYLTGETRAQLLTFAATAGREHIADRHSSAERAWAGYERRVRRDLRAIGLRVGPATMRAMQRAFTASFDAERAEQLAAYGTDVRGAA